MILMIWVMLLLGIEQIKIPDPVCLCLELTPFPSDLAETVHRGIFNPIWMEMKLRDVSCDARKMIKGIGG